MTHCVNLLTSADMNYINEFQSFVFYQMEKYGVTLDRLYNADESPCMKGSNGYYTLTFAGAT